MKWKDGRMWPGGMGRWKDAVRWKVEELVIWNWKVERCGYMEWDYWKAAFRWNGKEGVG